jgi:hypothetical protein
MSYINKVTGPLISTILTDAARKRMSQGNFNISYFQVGDSEVSYNTIDNLVPSQLNVLMPQYNAQNLTPAPESNRHHVKYPLFLDSTSGSTYGIPYDASYVDNIYNSAAPRGFFTGSTATTFNYSAYTSSDYTINPNYFVYNTGLTSGNTVTLNLGSINPSVSGTVTPGMFMTLFTTNSITPVSGNSSMFTYVVVGVTGNTSGNTTVTIQLDRDVPNFNSMGYSGSSFTLFYPSGMTALYDSVTPQIYWATNVFNYETNCDVSQSDVKVWNMNIPWTESPAGVFPLSFQDYNFYKSTGYTGSKEYFGYTSNDGQVDTGSVYFTNSMDQNIILSPSDQKSIAIIHYTNQTIDNFYGEKFAQQPYDATNPGGTGQARNFKISIPWLMWHKNTNRTIGQDFYTDPSGFTQQNLFQAYYIKSKKDAQFNNPGLRYYNLWDTHANADGLPSRVGKVFPDYKMVIFDDDEIVAALSYKSNRSWTLPAPKVGTIIPNACEGVLGEDEGLLSANTESVFVTYRFNNSAFTNSLHCNYYTRVNPILFDPNQPTYNIFLKFGNEFPFLVSNASTIPTGFTANQMKVLVQKVSSGTTRPDSTAWKEIDVMSQLSGSTNSGFLTLSGLTGSTIQITKDMYDNAPVYNLNNYIDLPPLGSTGITLNFGSEYYFYGAIKTDIQATIYVMNFLCNLGQTQFLNSTNPTWNGTAPYVTEVALYNDQKELMVISKIQSPEKRQGIQQYPVKLDF